MTKNADLLAAELLLCLGPVAMARAMGVSYDTYKNWRSERTAMPAVAVRCVELLLDHPKAARELAVPYNTSCVHCGEDLTERIPTQINHCDVFDKCPYCADLMVWKFSGGRWWVWARIPKK
jgi:hypothetical protein